VSARVAIVGAGPVGTTLALLLAAQGVQSVLVDRAPSTTIEGSRALCQQREVLDTWDVLGAGAIWREGVTWSVGRTYVRDREVRVVRLADPGRSPLPAFVNISQRRVEEVLAERVVANPAIEVRRGTEVTRIDQDDEGVVVVTDAGEIRAELAILAAGAHADSLRAGLGVELVGESHPDRFLICDIEADLPEFAGERRFWFDPSWNPGRQVLIHAQPNGVFRIDWQVPEDFDLAAELASGGIEARVRAIVHDRPWRLVWASVYRFHNRLATSFLVGRVALVGDAAHLVSPFGARGLNSGVHDAENLAWKVAAVLAGASPWALLDTYAHERRSAAEANLAATRATMRFLAPATAADRDRRRVILEAAWAGEPEAIAQVDSGRLYVPACYADSPLTTPCPDRPFLGWGEDGLVIAPTPGMVLPDLVVPSGERLRALVRFAGAVIAPSWAGEAVARIGVGTRCRPRVLELDEVDPEGVLRQALRLGEGEGVVVRPDGHIAGFAFDPAEAGRIAERAVGLELAESGT